MGTYTYIIIGNPNGGSGSAQSMSGTVSSVPAIVSLTFSNPSRSYYNFKGWSDSTTATVGTYSTRIPINVPDGGTYVKTVYAAWEHQTAYVYFKANGGSGAPTTIAHWAGYGVTLPATEPTRTGYIFLGWATSASATTAQYQPSTTYNLFTTVTLYAVWKVAADKLSTSAGTMGSAMTLNITKYDASYTDDITYTFGSVTGTIATGTTATTISWTPPTTLASEIPNASSGTLKFTVKTYENGTLLGSSTTSVTLSVPQSLAPTASVSFADTVATCLGWGIYVQSRSKLSFTITASAQESATIASYATSVNGSSYSDASFTTDVLLYSGSNTYTTVVTDSRGLQTTVTGTFTVITYSNPSVTLISCDRDDSDGEQVNIEFDFNVASVSSNNDANYAIDYKKKSASSWTSGTETALGAYSGTITDTLTGIDEGDEYDIRIRVIDSFTTASVETEVGVSGNILLNSRHEGGLGLLMKSQAEDQMDVGKNTVFHGSNKEMYGSTVGTHSASGTYAKVLSFGANIEAGKNLLNYDTSSTTINEVTFTVNSDKSVTVSGTATAQADFYLKGGLNTTEEILPSTGNYIINGAISGSALIRVIGLTSSFNVTSTADREFTATATTGKIILRVPNGATVNGTFYPMIRYATETDPTYEPYVDTSNMAVDAPITLEYIRTSDENPTELTINFATNYTLTSFVTNNSTDAYLVNSATAVWDLYIGKDSSDKVEILDFHNPWSNSDMTITWGATSVSTLPTGYTQATEPHTRIEETTYLSIATSAWTSVIDITLTEGTWLVSANALYGTNATGRRQTLLSTSADDGTPINNLARDVRGATDGGYSFGNFVDVITVASSTTYYLNAWQNSGSSLTVTGSITAIKII